MTPTALKRARSQLGLSQQALADELGVHRVTVAKWEAGDRRIPNPVARLLERMLSDARPKRASPRRSKQ